MATSPRYLTAGEREDGVDCLDCHRMIGRGEEVAICNSCGGVHHANCWSADGGCASYDCAEVRVPLANQTASVLKVSAQELNSATPLPRVRTIDSVASDFATGGKRRWNKLAVWSFAVAILSVPLFGIVTGLVAAVLGCIALVIHEPSRRGIGLAASSIGVGILSCVGWGVGLFFFFGGFAGVAAIQEMEIDFASFADLPAPINRAMRANVVIETNGLLGPGLGSGVILQDNPNETLIVTNRHVIDPGFRGGDGNGKMPNLEDLPGVIVRAFDSSAVPGRVVWVAPNDIDLALVSSIVSSRQILEASWKLGQKMPVGTKVFAIGNPHGLSWAYTSGDISQVRRQRQGPVDVRVVQTSAAINPGNSGGGLYTEAGRLVGINTWTKDKRFADGLSFSITFDTLLELVPDRFDIPNESRPEVGNEVGNDPDQAAGENLNVNDPADDEANSDEANSDEANSDEANSDEAETTATDETAANEPVEDRN